MIDGSHGEHLPAQEVGAMPESDIGEDPSPPDVRYGEHPPTEEVGAAIGQAGTEQAAAQLTTVREVELKLRVHGLFQLPDLVAIETGVSRTTKQVTRQLYAVYHDTADLRLFRWGITLRRRVGGTDAGWHMKLPVADADLGVRDEIRLPLDAGEVGAVPAELRDIVFPLTRGALLEPIATLQTDRTPYLLYDGEGIAFAELVDDTVSILDGDQVVARFRELEVEALIPDAPLQPVVDALAASGAVPGHESKAATALGPATKGPPDVAKPGAVGPDDPASAALVALLRRHIRAFMLQDVRVRRDLPDSVHQMRVAARRLRSGLKAFGSLVDPIWAENLRTELAIAASELGVARDTEVLMGRLDKHAEELGEPDAHLVRAVIDPRLRERLAQARSDALRSLLGPRHQALLESLVQAARSPQFTPMADLPSREVLPPLVERAYRRLARQVNELRLEGPAEQWHAVRIAAKRARYAADAVTNVFGSPAKQLANVLAGVTEVLGEHQDACVAQDVLREMAATASIDGRTGFALGLLHEHEFEEELHARLEFERLWPGVRLVHKKVDWL